MNAKDKFDRILRKCPHPHQAFFHRPDVNRRRFLELMGAGLTASFLGSRVQAAPVISQTPVTTINKAKNVIFVLLSGAPSHLDTFDFKETPDTPMELLKPQTISGIAWPAGIMPKLADKIPDMAIVRSVRSWALQHSLAQVWAQIGRSPAAALGDIAPNIGSVVAIEKEKERTASQVFPTFLALNSGAAIGSGYLSSSYAPFKVAASAAGLPNTTHPATGGESRFTDRYNLMNSLDGPMRTKSPLGRPAEDFDGFYKAARGLIYSPTVDQAFKFSTADSQRYGNNAFGNACLVAKQVLAANQGTRFIQVTLGGWDHHQNIYDANNLPRLTRILDDGLAALLTDLKSSGLLNETLVVVMGEFGRTVGRLTGQAGRDHFLQQFAVFAGAGVRGGRAIGSTNAAGSQTAEYGWSRDRDIRNEDIEATLYSAMGINWTTIRYDDPFGRGFEYVPLSKQDVYGPVNELWS